MATDYTPKAGEIRPPDLSLGTPPGKVKINPTPSFDLAAYSDDHVRKSIKRLPEGTYAYNRSTKAWDVNAEVQPVLQAYLKQPPKPADTRKSGERQQSGKIFVSASAPINEQAHIIKQAILANQDPKEPYLYQLSSGEMGYLVKFDGGVKTRVIDSDTLNIYAMDLIEYTRPEINHTVIRSFKNDGRLAAILPPLNKIAPAPVFGSDLQAYWKEGYAPTAKTYVSNSLAYDPSLMTSASEAAQYLLSYFDSFAIMHQSSRADLLAMMLTPYLTNYISGNIPGLLTKAPEHLMGKTQAAQVVAILGSGIDPPLRTMPKGAELGKQITTILKELAPVAIWDNIKGTGLDDARIESLLTTRLTADRTIYTQDDMKLANDTLWIFTQNGGVMSQDMVTRLIMVTLDVNVKGAPKEDETVISRALANRARIAHAVASIIESWAKAGKPNGSVTLKRYAEWSQVLSGILEHAGVSGFLESWSAERESVHTDSDDETEIRHAIYVLSEKIGKDKFTVSELDAKAEELTTFPTPPNTAPEYVAALAFKNWAKTPPGADRGRSVGTRLSQLVDKPRDNMVLRKKRVTKGWVYWWENTGKTLPEMAKAYYDLEAAL